MGPDDDLVRRLQTAIGVLQGDDRLTPQRMQELAAAVACRMATAAQRLAELQDDRPVRGTEEGFVVVMLAAFARHVSERGSQWLTTDAPPHAGL